MDERTDWALVPAMFVRPRRTIATIMEGERHGLVFLLGALSGIVSSVGQLSDKHVGADDAVWLILLVAVLGGALSGVISLGLFGWLGAVTGRWFGGRGSAEAMRAALAWGGVPFVSVLVLLVVRLLMFGSHAFSPDLEALAGDPVTLWSLLALDLATVVLAFWSLVTTLAAISQVHAFSVAKAVGSLMLAGVLVAVPLLALVWFVALMR